MNLKRKITLNDTTPLEVIINCFKCCNYLITEENIITKKQKRIEYYNSFNNFFEQKETYNDKDLEQIASFTSYLDVKWTKETLLKSFDHILKFETNIEDYLTVDFKSGPKDNENIYNYDSIMIYQLCCHCNINTTFDSTLEQMVSDIEEYLNVSKKEIFKDISRKLCNYSKTELIKLNKTIEELKNNKDYETYYDISDINLLKRTLLTNEESIIYCVKYYWIDVSESECPYDEMIELHYCKNTDETYKPIDENFSINYTKNKYYYQLDYFYRSEFKDFYSSKCISNLLKHESIDLNDPELFFQYLDDIIKSNNFYCGIFPHSSNESTFIYKEDIEDNTLISYGTYNDNIVVTPNELSEFFLNHNEFMEIKECKSVLDKRLIDKLIKICKQNPLDNQYIKLLNTIQTINRNKNIINETIQNLISVYKIENQKIDQFLTNLFELSMYMRGWKVNNNYQLPLNKNICNENSFHTEKIEMNIHDSMTSLFKFIDELEPHIKNVIKELPLIKLNENDKTFYRNTNIDEGLTLIERLNIIVKNDNVYSCIRMSSNYIASTYYYYDVIILKNTQKFSIDEMDFIQ